MNWQLWMALLGSSLLFQSLSLALPLKEVLDRAEDHPSFKSLRLDVEASELTRFGSYLNWGPVLSVDRSFSGGARGGSRSPLEYERLSLEAELNLFRGFGDLSRTRALQYGLASQRGQTELERRGLKHQVAELYFRCYQSQALLREAVRAVEIRGSLADIARQRYQSGSLARDEFIKLRIDHQSQVSRRFARATEFENCLVQLEYWIQMVPELEAPELLPAIRATLERELNIDEHLSTKVFENALSQGDWQVRQEASGFWPVFNVSLSKYPETSYQEAEESLFFSLQWRLFDQGQTWTDYQLARIEHARTQLALADFKKQTAQEFGVAKNSLRQALERFTISQENRKLAEEIFRSSLNRFQRGAISSNEVALDQSRVIDTAMVEWEAWFSVHNSWLEVLEATGADIQDSL